MATGTATDTDHIRSVLDPLFADLDSPLTEFDQLVSTLRVAQHVARLAEIVSVRAIARIQTDRGFSARGQRDVSAVADLLGIEWADARRLVTAADTTAARTSLTGQPLPPVLPATAAAFTAGTLSLRHVEVIARLLRSRTAGHLQPHEWAGAEEHLALRAPEYTPHELRTWGERLIEQLDQDGERPDDAEPEQVNELHLTPDRHRGGGRLKGRLDAAGFAALRAVLDAKAAPLTAQDDRPLGERQGDALVEILEWVADHADAPLPATGGHRPHIALLVELRDLQALGRGAMLEHDGNVVTPAALRRFCCDAWITPIVLGGTGQPLDVGRKTRTIPEGLRHAVTARDRGCAHPGCNRPPSWCEIHHVLAWEKGGETKLENLVMLCRRHHREVHSSEWEVHIPADGIPEFIPPRWIDIERKPRRKPPLFRPAPPASAGDP